MAEFCLDCWNEMNGTNDPPEKYIITDDFTLCEGCGEFKPVIVIDREEYYRYKCRFVLFPVRLVCTVLYVLWKVITLPYRAYKRRK